ncbi:MAG: ABC transporter ATP-binding protein [Lysobacterales bacterium]
MSALLELEAVGLRYHGGSTPVLSGLSLRLAAGHCLAVVGESGCGKSSLAAALIGLAPAAAELSGQLRFAGQTIGWRDQPAWRRLRGRRIGFVFQDAAQSLHPLLRIDRQLAELLPLAADRIAALAEVGLDAAALAARYPHQLSGGQRQRVMIALALALAPELLICDEPTSALDAVASAGILRLLGELKRQRGVAVILISHDLDAVAGIADQLLLLEPGRVAALGDCAYVLARDDIPALARLLRRRPRMVGNHQSSVARMPATAAGPGATSDDAAMLSLRGLKVAYRGRSALSDVDLELTAGQALGVIGASGSGKSSLARALLRLLPASAARLRVAGRDPRDLRGPALKRWRREVQIVFQDPATALDPQQTVAAAIGEALDLHGLCRSASDRRQRIAELLGDVQLPAQLAGRYPSELSGGQQQRVAIARALAVGPRLLVLDEAVSALDIATQGEILDLLTDLRDRHRLTLVFIGHDLAAVAAVADRLLVIADGRLVESGPTAQLLAAPQHPATRALIAALPARLRLSLTG